MNSINQHLIKISSGKAAFTGPLEMGADVLFAGKGSVTKIEDTDNQDGTFDRTYVVKVEYAEDISYKEVK